MTKKSQRAGRRGLQERELSCERLRGGHGPGVSGHQSQGRRVLRAEPRKRPEGGRASSHRDPAGEGDKFRSNSTGVMGKCLL